MNLVKVKCAFCSKKFFRERGRYNEAMKFGWNQFCSKECLSHYRTKEKWLVCENCAKDFMRKPSGISPHNYCSNSCAAKVNNRKYPKRQGQLKVCANIKCNKQLQFKGGSKYCSRECKFEALRRYTSKELIEIIKRVARRLKRVPAKRELKEIASACKQSFGSWNNAINAAGFQPNRSHSQRMYRRIETKALDGHLCDSVSEAIIDDWLTKNNIVHKKNVPYPETNHKADWIVSVGRRKIFIEYFGLANDSPRYDRTIRKKRMLCHKHKLTLVAIYPQDLYPKEYLDSNLKNKFNGLMNL